MQVGLKERLIGAVVLVIVAAIVIPWVLKGNSTSGGATVSKPLTLPAAATAAPVQTYRLPLNALSSAAAPPAGVSSAQSGRGSPPALAPRTQVPEATPAPRPHAQRRPTVPAQAAPAKPAPVTPAGKWVVQAGSYDSEHNAHAVERKLKAHGYRAFVSRYRSGAHTFYRVRVGPYSSKAEAARAVAKISRAAGAKAAVMPNSRTR